MTLDIFHNALSRRQEIRERERIRLEMLGASADNLETPPDAETAGTTTALHTSAAAQTAGPT